MNGIHDVVHNLQPIAGFYVFYSQGFTVTQLITGILERIEDRKRRSRLRWTEVSEHQIVVLDSGIRADAQSILDGAVSGFAGSNSLVFVMDLLRPKSREQASKLTELHVSEEPKILQRDFYNSLLAAYRTDEIEAQLERAGLGHFSLEVVSDYHLVVWGTMPLD